MTNNVLIATNSEPIVKSKRKAVRYEHSHIQAYLSLKHWLQADETIMIKIINISSAGLRIYSKEKFTLNKTVVLTIDLNMHRKQTVQAKVIHVYGNHIYGLKFQKPQHALIDALTSGYDHHII